MTGYAHTDLRSLANEIDFITRDAAPQTERLREIAAEIEPQQRQRFYRFEVKSSFPFPPDMLRYDRCWPVDSETANLIALTLGPDQVKGIVTYRLEGWMPHGPNRKRWESFMFRVENVEEIA